MARFVLMLIVFSSGLLLFAPFDRLALARGDNIDRLPDDLVARHRQYPDCIRLDDPIMPREGRFFHARLDKETEIYGILCEPASYNWPYVIYLVRDGISGDAERLRFADYDRTTGWTGTDVLYNASFDRKTATLKAFSKARGLGDCGAKTTLKWHDKQFNLVEFRYKENCDGDIDKPFPLIYLRTIGK